MRQLSRRLPLLLLAAALAASEHRLPATWTGTEDAPDGHEHGPWAVKQIWPDRIETWANYQPLVWRGGRWAAAANGHGEAPSAGLVDGALRITAEGNWGGNPGQKLAALVFTAPADGVYAITGEIAMKRRDGGGPNHVALLRLVDKEVGTVRSWRFRRPAPEPSAIDEAVFLPAGGRLAFVPRFGDNNKADITIADLVVTHAAASAAPGEFVAGARPARPRPPATGDPVPATVVEGEQVVFPADANVINVKDAPWNAKGDGVTDDTDAIQRAIHEGGVIYLPNGVYVVSDQLRYSKGARVPSRCTLHGQSIGGTILKLRDRTPDFGDPKTPFAVVWTSKFPPQAFRIHVRNLTVHTGTGNPGAIGIQFYANNQGSIEDVRILSGDGAGVIGLDLGHEHDQGPMLARGIRVEGFDVGVRCAKQTTVTTLEDISVEGQKVCGFLNDLHCVAMRRFTSRNAVPAFIARDPGAYTAIVEGRIDGLPGGEPGAAIRNEGGMFLRGVQVTGYAKALASTIPGHEAELDALPAEWTSHPPLTLWEGSATRSLGLEIRDTPRMPWLASDQWVSVKAFPPEVKETGEVSRGKKVTYQDWMAAIRAAFASGKPVVYFPRGNYVVDGSVEVPPHVRRIIGIESAFNSDRGRAEFVVKDGTEPLLIDRWDWNYSKVTVRHAGPRTLVLRNVVGSHYAAEPGAGDLFMDDCCQGGIELRKGQKVWMRQFNPEYGDKPKIINDGADLWILGIKTEGYSSMIMTRNGGRTEILGGMAYANQGHDPEPLFINLEPYAFSCSLGEWVLRSQRFEEIVVEKRGGATRVLRCERVPARGDKPDGKPLGGYGTSFNLPLFASWEER